MQQPTPHIQSRNTPQSFKLTQTLLPNLLTISITKLPENIHHICTISEQQLQQKLHTYFQNLQELEEYLSISEHVRIDWELGKMKIVAMGPTRKANVIFMDEVDIVRVKEREHERKGRISRQGDGGGWDGDWDGADGIGDVEMWIDDIAGHIVELIQSKSRIKDRVDSDKNIDNIGLKRLQDEVSQLRKQLHSQIQKLTQQLQSLKPQQSQQSLPQLEAPVNKNILLMTQQQPSPPLQSQSNQQREKEIEEMGRLIREKDIQDLREYVSNFWSHLQNYEEVVRICQGQIRDEFGILDGRLRKDIYDAIVGETRSRHQEMDVIIKKIQNMGLKLESMLTQNSNKEQSGAILQQKLMQQQRKLSQIEVKLNRETLIPPLPQNPHSSETPSPSFPQPSPSCSLSSSPSPSPSLSPMNPLSWLDPTCSHIGRISTTATSITMISYSQARVLSKLPITTHPTFNIQIQSIQKSICIGVIDVQYKDKLLLGNQANFIAYNSDCRLECAGKEIQKMGSGFGKDQIVTVVVDLTLGIILWRVGDGLRFSWQSDLLKERKIVWVPVVRLYDRGDRFSVLQ